MESRRMLMLVVGFAFWCSLRADQVLLENGDRLTGTIVSSDLETMSLTTEFLGKVQIKWGAVEALTADQVLYVAAKGGQVLVGTVSTSGESFQVKTAESGLVTVSKSSVESLRSESAQAAYKAEIERLRDPSLLDLWSGNLDAGLSLAQGNAEATNFSSTLRTERKTTRDKISIYATSLFARDSTSGVSETTANAIRGGTQYDINLSDRLFSFGFIDLEFDEFQNLDLRNVLGGGLGWRIRDTEQTSFSLLFGGSFNQEFFSGDVTRRAAEVVLGEELSHQLFGGTSLSEKLVFYPNMSESGEFRIQFDTSISTEVGKGFAWHVTFSDRFLSNPLPDLEKNDILFATGVRFNFGKGS